MNRFITLIMLFTFASLIAKAQAPAITYTANNVFTAGTVINDLFPNSTGGAVTAYAAAVLPAGLHIDAGTGRIYGTPTAPSGTINYTITATNATAPSNATVQITINSAAPNITYAPAVNSFKVGVTIGPLAPDQHGIPVQTFTINPGLPKGLSMDKSGIITGTPLQPFPPGLYTVTATNTTGTGQFTLTIAVSQQEPYFSYPLSATYVQGILIPDPQPNATKKKNDETTLVYRHLILIPPDLHPAIVSAAHIHPIAYTISPALPAGLQLDPLKGIISGTPTTVQAPAKYVITGSYADTPPVTDTVTISVLTDPDIITGAPTISFVGQGDIQQSLNSGTKLPATTGIGVIYRENSNVKYGILHHIEIDFSVNVASTVDTIKSMTNSGSGVVNNKNDFGNSVLLPLNSGEAFSFRSLFYFTSRGGLEGNYERNSGATPLGIVFSGLDIAVQGSTRNWAYTDNSQTTPLTTQVKASQLSTYVGIFHEFITPNASNNYGQNASVTVGAGYSGRFVMGDVAQSQNDALRAALLGTQQKSFQGFEIKLGLRFYDITAEVHLPFLHSKDNAPGLSGSQPYTFIGFTGGFPIQLTKPAAQAASN